MDIGLHLELVLIHHKILVSALIIVPYKKKHVTSNKKLFIDFKVRQLSI